MLENDDRCLSDLVNTDDVDVAEIVRARLRERHERRGTKRLGATAKVEFAQQTHHHQAVLVGVVKRQVAHLATCHDASCSRVHNRLHVLLNQILLSLNLHHKQET